MQKQCKQCGKQFEITEQDMEFYKRISPEFGGKRILIPPPTLCSACRMQRRLSFRNERNLHHRKCDLSGKQMVTMYSPDKFFKVYDQAEWWGDKWNSLDYGRDYNFTKPFFSQFAELLKEVPRINLINKEHENSEYCNFAFENKNSYLLFTAAWCEDSCYSNRCLKNKDIYDCSNVTDLELCYEVVDCDKCYNCAWLQNCSNCSDCWLGYDLKGCKNCFACFSLVNKQYCVGNKEYSKEEYEKIIADYKKNFESVKTGYEKHLKDAVRKYIHGVNLENCVGFAMSNSRNCFECFEVQELEDCRYVSNATKLKDCCDINNNDHSELDYEVVGGEGNYNQCFCDISWFNKFVYYCSLCFHSQNCFGCVGLNKNKYCILNKQYSKEEYEALVSQIIESMKSNGEFGEFFPTEISPFAYNETCAQDYFPLSKEEVEKKGWKWQEDESEKKYKGPDYKIPENVEDVDEGICKQILRCEATGKCYKILPNELKFYKRMGISVPKKGPDQRHKERLELRNPRCLYDRKCDKCGVEIRTTYATDRPEKVYCEECYKKEVY